MTAQSTFPTNNAVSTAEEHQKLCSLRDIKYEAKWSYDVSRTVMYVHESYVPTVIRCTFSKKYSTKCENIFDDHLTSEIETQKVFDCFQKDKITIKLSERIIWGRILLERTLYFKSWNF